MKTKAKSRNSLLIVHLVYSGLAGSPRGALYLAQGEKRDSRYKPFIFFIGKKIENEYIRWADSAKLDYRFIRKKSTYDFLFIVRLLFSFLAIKPNLIFVHGTINLLYALPYILLWRKRFILVEHGPELDLDRKMTQLMAHVANRFAQGLVLVSRELESFWRERFGRFPQMHVAIPNGVDLNEFNGLSKDRNGPPLVLMVAIMSAQKDHLGLIQAVHKLHAMREIELILVGEGPLFERIKKEIADIDANNYIRIISGPTRFELKRMFINADIYVQATHGEGLSRAVLEAMVAGVPVIGSDVSGNRDIIMHEKTGILVPPGDIDALADSISYLLDNSEKSRQLAFAALNYVTNHHSIERAVESYFAFIEETRKQFQY